MKLWIDDKNWCRWCRRAHSKIWWESEGLHNKRGSAIRFPSTTKPRKPQHPSQLEWEEDDFYGDKRPKGHIQGPPRAVVEIPLCLYTQNFTLGKPQKYTHPHKWISHFFTKAYIKNQPQRGDFYKQVLHNIISHASSNNLENTPHLNGGPMLTRIAYQGLGMIDKLPPPLTQAMPAKLIPSPP